MKKVIAILMVLIVSLSLVACGSQEQVSLVGEWKEGSEEPLHLATITEDTIEVYWLIDGDKLLYWAGSYDNSNATFTSNNDFEKTESGLFTSSDDTKEFIVNNGTISYQLSAMGEELTVELEKVTD